MQITLIAIGKTDNADLERLIDQYEKRLGHYIKFQFKIVPDLKNTKNLSETQQKEKEGELILAQVQSSDVLILLDETGKQYSSMEFSQFLQKKMNSGIKNLILVIGGPYGFSEGVYQRCDGKISLSKMTFSHQMVRLFVVEQLYRGFTILRNEPYHHQ
ncbi:MAG: 23S rRNA (pseudouridine(1915)-N(3))-methyltransferase RlmH [Allomuricauda sp.]